MPMIFEEMLQKDISGSVFAPCYIIFGDDIYLKKYYTDLLCKKSYGGDPFFNMQSFEGDCDLQDVFDAVNQYPMMADKKCVFLSDYDFEHCSKSDFDKLCELLENPVDGCTLIISFYAIEFDGKKGSKEQRLIKSAEKGNGKAVCLDHRNPAKLAAMLVSGAKRRGCRLDNSIASKIVEFAGDDISILQSELDKLCNYCENNIITLNDVEAVVSKSVEASVYDYVKCILAKNTDMALKILNDMFYLKTEPMVILYTAAASYIDMCRMSFAKKCGVSRNDVAKDFAYKNRAFTLERAEKSIRNIDDKQLKLSFEALLKADKALKSYSADQKLVLEKLTVELIYIISKGESVDKA